MSELMSKMSVSLLSGIETLIQTMSAPFAFPPISSHTYVQLHMCMPSQSATSQVLQTKLDAMLLEKRKRDASTMRSVHFRGNSVDVKEETVSDLLAPFCLKTTIAK